MFITILDFLGVTLVGGAVLGCLYLLASAGSLWAFSRQKPSAASSHPPVTILKPLSGDEHDLAANLRSFCQQNYANYQIIFGVQKADDSALPIIRAIMAEFPKLDIHLVVESARQSENMKVANLQNMLSSAKHDYLVIADSDMRVEPNYLAEVIAPLLDETIGVVTCLYRGVSRGNLWSELGSMQLNYNFMPQAMLGETLKIGNGCFGATLALRRKVLDDIGGFSAIGHVLADDHELGLLVRRKGLRVLVSSHIIDNVINEPNFLHLFRHESRWARTIYIAHPQGYAGSLITHPIAFALLASLIGYMPDRSGFILAGVLAVRFLTAFVINRTLRLPLGGLWLLPLRDMLSFAVFLNGFFYRTVKWRDSTFHVAQNGHITLDGDTAV